MVSNDSELWSAILTQRYCSTTTRHVMTSKSWKLTIRSLPIVTLASFRQTCGKGYWITSSAFHVLSSGVDDRVILSIFARMNSTGVKLNRQELRNADYHGALKTSMYGIALGHFSRWRGWRIFSDDGIARMQEVELTSEFAYLMFNGLTAKSEPALDRLYKDNDDEFPEREEVERETHYHHGYHRRQTRY